MNHEWGLDDLKRCIKRINRELEGNETADSIGGKSTSIDRSPILCPEVAVPPSEKCDGEPGGRTQDVWLGNGFITDQMMIRRRKRS